jgi:dUTP pyrophosphatase
MIQFKKVRDVKSPTRGTNGSAGLDFYIPENFNGGNVYQLDPNKSVNIPSGIHIKFPRGYALVAFNKSGISTKKELVVGACVIDSDYQGEIHLHLINVSALTQFLSPGDKITQFLLLPAPPCSVEEVDTLEELYPEETERGMGGFGSTGNE